MVNRKIKMFLIMPVLMLAITLCTKIEVIEDHPIVPAADQRGFDAWSLRGNFDAWSLWSGHAQCLSGMFQIEGIQKFVIAIFRDIGPEARKFRDELRTRRYAEQQREWSEELNRFGIDISSNMPVDDATSAIMSERHEKLMRKYYGMPSDMTENTLPGIAKEMPPGTYKLDEFMNRLFSPEAVKSKRSFAIYQYEPSEDLSAPENPRSNTRSFLHRSSTFETSHFELNQDSFSRLLETMSSRPDLIEYANIRTIDLLALALNVIPRENIRATWCKKIDHLVKGLAHEQSRPLKPRDILNELGVPPDLRIDLASVRLIFDGSREPIPQEECRRVTTERLSMHTGKNPWLKKLFESVHL